MDCLVSPAVSLFRRRSSMASSRLGYRPLMDIDHGYVDGELLERPQVTVVVGKEKREFLVDPFVLEESPFRVLIDTMEKEHSSHQAIDDARTRRRSRTRRRRRKRKERRRVIFVDVDAILFEHMLWLMNNDSSSLFQLNLNEIIDFYAQDN